MADLAIRDGLVVTGGPAGAFQGDVVVEGGRIVALEPASGSRGAAATDVVDARGCLVIPGLVQAHVHLCQTILRGLADDLDVVDWLRLAVWPAERAHTEASLGASAALGIAELLLSGTTTVLSMESVHHTDASFEAAAALGIRAVIGKALMDRWEPGTEMVGEGTDEAWSDHVRLTERWHGAAGGRLRVAASPRGPRNATPELWRQVAHLAAEAGQVVHTHVGENAAQAERLAAQDGARDVELLEAWGALGPSTVMAHCVWLSDTERALVRRRGAHVCHCPSANLKLGSGVAPVPAYLAEGINVALGADGSACNNRLDAFEEMRLAALVHKPRWGPTAMPAHTVLALATVGGARALGLEHEIGTLEVGKRADVVVVRADGPHAAPRGDDPWATLVYALRGGDVDTVLVDGRPVVRAGTLRSGDLAAIVAAAEGERSALVERAGLVGVAR